MQHYLMSIITGIQNKYKLIENNQPGQNIYISLIEIKTLLDSFDQFKQPDQQTFRPLFLEIASYGLSITTRIVENYVVKRVPFTTVGDLGASLSVLRNSLRICEKCEVSALPMLQYVNLMNVVTGIFKDGIFL